MTYIRQVVGGQLLPELQIQGAGTIFDGGEEVLDLSEEDGQTSLGVADDLVLLLVAQIVLGVGEQAGELQEFDNADGDASEGFLDGVVQPERVLNEQRLLKGRRRRRMSRSGRRSVDGSAAEFQDDHVGRTVELGHQTNYF